MLLEPLWASLPWQKSEEDPPFHTQGGAMGQCMSWIADGVCCHLLPLLRKLVCSALSAGRPWSMTSVL